MRNTLNLSDGELIRASQSGDQAAFGQLVIRYQSLICSIAYNRCGDISFSEDIAQEAFVQAWKKLSDLQEAAKFKSWLCTIVRNLANRRHSRHTHKPMANAASLESVADVAQASNDPAESVLEAEQQQLVWNALSQIPEKYREPMILFYREDQSVNRVAESLDLTPGAVKQRLSRGRKMLHWQMVQTVEKTLSETKPNDQFASAVLLGVSQGSKAAIAGGASKAASLLTGSSGMFWLSFAQLPLVVWLAQLAIKETRSDAERALVIRHIVLCGLGLIPMVAVGYAYIYFQPPVPAFLKGLVIPLLMVLYMIPMILYSRHLGKRMLALREEEGTATPDESLRPHGYSRKALTKLFLGSGLLIAMGTMLVPIYVGQWAEVLLMLSAACIWSLLATLFVGTTARRVMIAYAIGMGFVALSCNWVHFTCVTQWRETLSNASFWFLAGLQVQMATLTLLVVNVRRKCFGIS